MIARIWHGWTAPENAVAYEELLRTRILPAIRHKPGCRCIHLFRREGNAAAGGVAGTAASEVEFVTLLFFDSLDAIRAFAGAQYDVAVVPPEARKLLARFDERSTHYETVLTL
ncbi:MAG TPA: hypothetical protein VGA40_01595 [Candidatus Acidoferrales bacterium]